MAHHYPYDTTSDALYYPARGKRPEDFFQDWSDADRTDLPRLCAELARLAYGEETLVKATLPHAGLALAAWIGGEGIPERLKSSGTDGYVATRADATTFIVFRGTEAGKIEDVIADLRTRPVAWSRGGLVHAGFAAAYLAIHDRLAELLAAPPDRLVFVGHSLGAAVATLAASMFQERQPTLVTFGSPRVGDADFVAGLVRVTPLRHVDCCDIVARVPPERFDRAHIHDLLRGFLGDGVAAGMAEATLTALIKPFLGHAGYRHHGPAVYLDRHGQTLPTPSDDEIRADQDAARAEYFVQKRLDAALSGDPITLIEALSNAAPSGHQVPFRDLADHAAINYVSALVGRDVGCCC
jgi:pimeloyl-ACP methyl ester carboxylesterase